VDVEAKDFEMPKVFNLSLIFVLYYILYFFVLYYILYFFYILYYILYYFVLYLICSIYLGLGLGGRGSQGL